MVFLAFSGSSSLLPDSLVIQGTKHKSTVKSESFLSGDGLVSIPNTVPWKMAPPVSPI